MIFIWGKKLVYRNLGHVGDFCPMCRVPRAFSVRRVGLAGHIYYITSGEGELVGHERTCKECGIVLNANPATYAGFSKLNLPVNELLALTYPNFAAVMKDRLEVEERVRQGAAFLSPQERAALVQIPFALLSPRVEERLRNVTLDVQSGLTLLGAIVLTPMAISLAGYVLPASVPEEYPLVALVLIAAGLLIWQMAGVGRRFVKNQIVPALARTLRPLKPTDGEIQAVLAELRKHKHKLGSRLNSADLAMEMQKAA